MLKTLVTLWTFGVKQLTQVYVWFGWEKGKSVDFFFLTVNNFLKLRPPHSITSESLGSTLFSFCYCCSPVSFVRWTLDCLKYKCHRWEVWRRQCMASTRCRHREVNALHLHPACRASPSLIHLNVSDAAFVCLAESPYESQRAVTSVASDGPASRVAHQSSAFGFRSLEKQPKTMIWLIDDAAARAVSLTCNVTPKQAWRRLMKTQPLCFSLSSSGLDRRMLRLVGLYEQEIRPSQWKPAANIQSCFEDRINMENLNLNYLFIYNLLIIISKQWTTDTVSFND